MSEADNRVLDFELVFQRSLILVMATSEAYFSMLERHLDALPQTELRWVDEKIEALAEIFIYKPKLLVVFCDTNQESLDFIRLVRNNPNFREMPIFVVFTGPQKWKHKWAPGLNIAEKFETPIDGQLIYAKAKAILSQNQEKEHSDKKITQGK